MNTAFEYAEKQMSKKIGFADAVRKHGDRWAREGYVEKQPGFVAAMDHSTPDAFDAIEMQICERKYPGHGQREVQK